MRNNIFTLVLLSLVLGGIAFATAPQSSKMCKTNSGSFCITLYEACDGADGSCIKCTGTARNSDCKGNPGTCHIGQLAGGCGESQWSDCDSSGGCVNWQTHGPNSCFKSICTAAPAPPRGGAGGN